MKNYIITLSVQFTNDAEALAKTAAVAIHAGEIAYLKNGNADLGFFTKDGDYGAPKRTPVDAKPAQPPVSEKRAVELAHIDRVLEAYRAELIHQPPPQDLQARTDYAVGLALLQLLTKHRDQLPAVDDYFMKAFRQTDVTEDGMTDNAIWHLLSVARVFWEVAHKLQPSGSLAQGDSHEP